MTPIQRLKRIATATQSGGLGLKEGSNKRWHTYTLDILQLRWARNMMDGWQINVTHNKEGYIGEIQIDSDRPHIARLEGDDKIIHFDVVKQRRIT